MIPIYIYIYMIPTHIWCLYTYIWYLYIHIWYLYIYTWYLHVYIWYLYIYTWYLHIYTYIWYLNASKRPTPLVAPVTKSFLTFFYFFQFFLPERKQTSNTTRCAGDNGDFPAHFVRTPSRVLTGPTEKLVLIKKTLNKKIWPHVLPHSPGAYWSIIC
jgi:hypothetical protein